MCNKVRCLKCDQGFSFDDTSACLLDETVVVTTTETSTLERMDWITSKENLEILTVGFTADMNIQSNYIRMDAMEAVTFTRNVRTCSMTITC